jgi:uncharacterized protein (TIGR03000 family)
MSQKTKIGLTIAATLLCAFAAQAQEMQEARVRVYLPAPDAQLEVQGVMTKQTGSMRTFKSPPLLVGKNYAYDMKVTWTENGKPMVREKTITLQAGGDAEADFRMAEGPKIIPPPPMVDNNPKSPTPKPPDPRPPDPKQNKLPENPPKLAAPFATSPDIVVDKMLEIAKVKEGDVVYDLGCGDGRIVIAAVTKFKAKKGVGIDIDPERIKDSNENAKKANVAGKVSFILGDVLTLNEKDLSDATVITLYLWPDVNKKLQPILQKLKPGTRIVSHDFAIGDWKPDEQTKVKVAADGLNHDVYLWTVK